MNYVFKERLRESLVNFVFFVICVLILDGILMLCIAGHAPVVLVTIALIGIGIVSVYLLILGIYAFCIWVNWLFIEPFQKR